MTFSRDELELRSKQFAIDALVLAKQLGDMKELWDVVRQMTRASVSDDPRVIALHREATELRAIFAKAHATTRQKLNSLTH